MKKVIRLASAALRNPKVVKRSIIAAIALSVIAIPYAGCFHYTTPGHVGIMRNIVTGDLELDKPGWNLSAPWVKVTKAETRPQRVCVTSAGRGYNCKLVQFHSDRFREFVETEGFRYYWFANRFSFNFGYDEEYRGFRDLLRGYAFSAKKYPFVSVIESY